MFQLSFARSSLFIRHSSKTFNLFQNTKKCRVAFFATRKKSEAESLMKVLNVAEKPSAAKQIASILSNNSYRTRDGKSKYNKIFEFPFTLNGVSVQMAVTSVAGHLTSQDFSPAYKSWHSCQPDALFNAPIHTFVSKNMENLGLQLRTEARNASKLVLWLDCDREGEHIAFEVMEQCLQGNSNLECVRARFSAFVPNEIFHAVNNTVAPNALDRDAVSARMEIDLRIGAAFTRFQTLRFQNRYAGLADSILSYGPCQFPTLGFVVERYNEIKNFVPEPFWYLTLTAEKNGQTATFNWQRVRLVDEAMCAAFYERCIETIKNDPQSAIVESVTTKPKTKRRPVPLTTVELQKLASRKLKLSATNTMSIAESLYNKGFISYPRTETDSFPEGFDLMSLIRQQFNDPQWGEYAKGLVDNNKFVQPRQGKNNDNSHPPIHPTKSGDGLSGSEALLYELVTRHYLACCSDDAKGSETTIVLAVAAEQFTTNGLVIEALNYLEVYKYETWNAKTIPGFHQGEPVVPKSLEMNSGSTTAPKLLTEADLISKMDKNGIGTDATIAQHIQTIQDRKYVVKENNVFTPTALGAALVDGYDRIGYELSKPNLRAKMEADMVEIARGTKAKDDVVRDTIAMYQEVFEKVLSEAGKLDDAFGSFFELAASAKVATTKPNFSKCGCGSDMTLTQYEAGPRDKGVGNRELKCNDASCGKKYTVPRSLGVAPHEHRCPLCQTQVLTIATENKTTKKSSTWQFCPSCYHNPPSAALPDIENTHAAPVSSMPCFKCAADCPLSGGSVPVRDCPECAHPMSVRKIASNKKWILGCENRDCKYVLWMPDDFETVKLESRTDCVKCASRKPAAKSVKCRRVLVSIADQSGSIKTCFGGCDSTMLNKLKSSNKADAVDKLLGNASAYRRKRAAEALGRPTSARAKKAATATNTRQFSSSATPAAASYQAQFEAGARHVAPSRSNTTMTSTTSGVCYRCQQPGHWANACPSSSSAANTSSVSSRSHNNTTTLTCFACNQPGHISTNCPNKQQQYNNNNNNNNNNYNKYNNNNKKQYANHRQQNNNNQVCDQCQSTDTFSAIVKKKGPNVGRPFSKCNSCNNFKWGDE